MPNNKNTTGTRLSNEINSITARAETMMAETRLQFDTLIATQQSERMELHKMHQEEMHKVRKHYGRIIAGLIVTLAILLGGIIGGAVYIFSNYEFHSYNQTSTVGGDGTSTINDGVHIDTPDE